MIGVLIIGGIIGYAMVYSGISALGVVPSIPPTTTLNALWPNGPLGVAKAKGTFPKAVGGAGASASGQPRGGRTI